MGRGSQEKRMPIYYFTAKMKDKDDKLNPHFAVKFNDGIKTIDQPAETKISGYLVAIGTSQYYWPKTSTKPEDLVHTIEVILVDGVEKYKVSFSVDSNFGRTVMNSILGTPEMSVMLIRLWMKDEMPKIYINNEGGPEAEWKYNWNEKLAPLVKEYPDPKKPGKTVKVYHAVNELLFNDWKEYAPKVLERARKQGWVQKDSDGNAPGGVYDEPAGQDDGSLQNEFDGAADPETRHAQTLAAGLKLEDINSDDLPF